MTSISFFIYISRIHYEIFILDFKKVVRNSKPPRLLFKKFKSQKKQKMTAYKKLSAPDKDGMLDQKIDAMLDKMGGFGRL